jgi:uncharacterized protein (TIGR02271 family)
MRTVVGLFENVDEARLAIEELAKLGFAPQKISVVANTAASKAMATSPRGLELHTMTLSDVGQVAASGPIGELQERPGQRLGLIGLLQQIGFSSDLAEHYATGVQRGGALESLTVDDADADRVAAVMKKHATGPTAPTMTGQASKTAETTKAAAIGQAVESRLEPERAGIKREGHTFAEEERTIPVYREELRVGKREVERGGVHVATHIVEKPSKDQVMLREEHVTVERRPANRLVSPEGTEFKEKAIDMTEYGEEAVAAKETRLVEEVIVHKQVAERTATVEDKIRSTEVEVQTFDASKFGETLGPDGGSGRWEEIESKARSRWEAEHPGTWDKFKDSIRNAYSRAGQAVKKG